MGDRPRGAHALVRQAAAANRDWTFGWVAMAPNADPRAVGAALHAARAVTSSGFPGRLSALACRRPRAPRCGDADSGLHAVGVTPPDSSCRRTRPPAARLAAPSETIPLFVTLMDDDPHGRWRAGLSRLGVVVGPL